MYRHFAFVLLCTFSLTILGLGRASAESDASGEGAETSESSDDEGVDERLAEIQRLLEEEDELPEDVSHIEGQLVPVGEKNEYHYSFPRWNISTNPLGWMTGIFGASLSYAMAQNVAVRADANLFEDGTHELNLGVPIYFRRAYQGLFIEPGVMSRGDENDLELGPQALVGWHWRWDSGLNAAVAAGAGKDLNSEPSPYGGETQDTFVNGYLRFGYAF